VAGCRPLQRVDRRGEPGRSSSARPRRPSGARRRERSASTGRRRPREPWASPPIHDAHPHGAEPRAAQAGGASARALISPIPPIRAARRNQPPGLDTTEKPGASGIGLAPDSRLTASASCSSTTTWGSCSRFQPTTSSSLDFGPRSSGARHARGRSAPGPTVVEAYLGVRPRMSVLEAPVGDGRLMARRLAIRGFIRPRGRGRARFVALVGANGGREDDHAAPRIPGS